jgi:hypothetical protein
MKTFTLRSMIAVAALAVAAGSASAQTYKAEIPMAFHAGDKVMAPGTYDVKVILGPSGHGFIAVHNVNTKANVFLLPVAGSDAPKAWREAGNPVIAFECFEKTCSLRQVWTALDVTTYEIPARKLSPAQGERLAMVTVGLTKAD